jgi:hypothetical protein
VGYIGAIDQGTTSSRFIMFDASGAIVSVAQKEHAQIFPKPGWVEHDPLEIWRDSEEVIADALAKRWVKPSDLAAVGIISSSTRATRRSACATALGLGALSASRSAKPKAGSPAISRSPRKKRDSDSLRSIGERSQAGVQPKWQLRYCPFAMRCITR